uniref:Uncharacterized protein n=1 Tax=Fagus sylvatica TaxID=28930 RepID=A0A2N9GLX9_FAGSY
MLKMNKDHQSAVLWWSLLLSGGSLGGHGSSLGFICSCLVFSITSPMIACVAVDIFVKYLLYLMVNGENQLPCVMMMAWRVVLFAFEKHSISASSAVPKGGKRASYM